VEPVHAPHLNRQKLSSGPAVEATNRLLETMKQEGDCDEVEQKSGDRRGRVIARRTAELSLLSSRELALADQIVANLWRAAGAR
jgi:hypothetical protein